MKMYTSQPSTALVERKAEPCLAEGCTCSFQNRTRLGTLTVQGRDFFGYGTVVVESWLSFSESIIIFILTLALAALKEKPSLNGRLIFVSILTHNKCLPLPLFSSLLLTSRYYTSSFSMLNFMKPSRIQFERNIFHQNSKPVTVSNGNLFSTIPNHMCYLSIQASFSTTYSGYLRKFIEMQIVEITMRLSSVL